MPRPEMFRNIAERYLSAGHLTRDQVPEAAAFAAYHAFESIGSAWVRHKGQKVPRPHDSKINKFVALAKRESFRHGAAHLAILTTALRNKMLYPTEDGLGGFNVPDTLMSAANSRDLLRRVDGMVRSVSAEL